VLGAHRPGAGLQQRVRGDQNGDEFGGVAHDGRM
jgi:hypothetical protein